MEKNYKNVTKAQIFYEFMQFLFHRIDFNKIKGPQADFLNNNKDFQILDDDEFLSLSNDITDFYSTSKNGLSKIIM